MILYVMIAIATVLYLVIASVQDVRERMISVAPAIGLYAVWSAYLYCQSEWSKEFLCVFWLMHLLLYILLNRLSVWGAGDSDLFLVFADLCLIAGKNVDLIGVFLRESIYLCMALMVAIAVGMIEAKKKGNALSKTTGIAVAPGFAVTGVMLLIKGLCWRFI